MYNKTTKTADGTKLYYHVNNPARSVYYNEYLKKIADRLKQEEKLLAELNYSINDPEFWHGIANRLDRICKPFVENSPNKEHKRELPEKNALLENRLNAYTQTVTQALLNLLTNIAADKEELAVIFASSQKSTRTKLKTGFSLKNISWTTSDVHESGLPVMILNTNINDISTKIVYKPHTILTGALLNGNTAPLRKKASYQVKDEKKWDTDSLWEIMNKKLTYPLPTRIIMPKERQTPATS
ncbi:MAG: DUF4135 domain-containing protein, partial [Gammaproteobacteria bacterium]